jgi:hypothetical protein
MSAKAFKKLPSGVARATKEHMPFAGHRTCEMWIAQQAPRPRDPAFKLSRALQFGFDPESLRKVAR